MANCIKCGIELTKENRFPSDIKLGANLCKKCRNAKAREWQQKNVEKDKRARELWRKSHPNYHHNYYLNRIKETEAHYKERIAYQKEYYLTHNRLRRVMTTGNRVIYGTKRPIPPQGNCELCGKKPQKLAYHHYDDNDLMKGLWLCCTCHTFAERADKGFFPRYITLKETVLNYRGTTD